MFLLLKKVFLDMNFQNFFSSETIMSLSLLSLIFLSPIKVISSIKVLLPLSKKKVRLTRLFSNFSILASTFAKLKPIDA